MDGYGITAEFDGVCVQAKPTNIVARGALGTDNLIVPVADIVSLSMKNAGLMSNGRLELRTPDGRLHKLNFTRKQQQGFEALHAQLQALVAHNPARVRSGDTVASDRPAMGNPTPAPAVPTGPAAGTPLMLRGAGYFGQQVVGESNYGAQLNRVAGREREGEREVLAQLRREPKNRYDRNAIQVIIDGGVVGYLPREDAPSYQPELTVVEGWGRTATCCARLWWRRERGDVFASVSLDLAKPGELVPISWPDPATRHVLVPAGRWYQLSGESEHIDVLAPLLARAYVPGKAFAHASLHLVDREGPRSTTQVVVVRIEGGEVGELSKQTSTKLVPLLAPLRDAQVTCYAEASLTGNTLAVEARVALTMPEELSQEFVQRVQAVVVGS